jgi:hypothetical protein
MIVLPGDVTVLYCATMDREVTAVPVNKEQNQKPHDNFTEPATADEVEALLLSLANRLDCDSASLQHVDQGRSREWRGADLRITSDFSWEPRHFMEGHDLLVRTRHSLQLSWLFRELWDAFSTW